RDRGHHLLVRARRDLERGDEVGWQGVHVAPGCLVAAPRVVFNAVLLRRAVGHALLARVDTREGRLYAVGGVVGEGEADGASRRDRQQMRIPDSRFFDLLFYLYG